MNERDDLFAFTYIGSRDKNVSLLDDGVVHRKCLNEWEQRDAFVEAWNAEGGCLLEITPSGGVEYERVRRDRDRSILRRLRRFLGL